MNEYKQIFKEFDRQKIRYVVLRNDECLIDESLPKESIDMTIAAADMPKLDAVLKKHGFSKRTQQFSLKHQAYFKINTDIISFDIQMGGIYWNDMQYMDESILDRRKKKAFYYVLSDDDMAVMLIAHSILGKRYFKDKYRTILSELSYNADTVAQHLAGIFNKSVAERIMHNIKSNNFQRIPIKKLVLQFIAKYPLTFIKLFFRWIAWKKPLKPKPLISIVGPDGAGKSTLVQSLQHYLESNGRKVATIYTGRGRGHILPITTVGRTYKTLEKQSGQENTKSRGKTILYTIVAPIFTADLWLRYMLRILPKRMNNIVITDRYCTDIMLMKHVPFSMKKALLHLFPKPTISIYLYNTPETLHQRRPKEPIEELKRQMDIFEQFHYSLQLKTTDKKTEIEANEFVMKWQLRNWY
jgi:thymidylate kinase